MIPFGHGETVTRVRAARVSDRYNSENVEYDWDDTTDVPIQGCGVALSSTVDPLLDARQAVDSDFTVFAPSGSDINPDDRLVVRDLECEVVGRPFDWSNPFTGWTPGMVVQAKVREG